MAVGLALLPVAELDPDPKLEPVPPSPVLLELPVVPKLDDGDVVVVVVVDDDGGRAMPVPIVVPDEVVPGESVVPMPLETPPTVAPAVPGVALPPTGWPPTVGVTTEEPAVPIGAPPPRLEVPAACNRFVAIARAAWSASAAARSRAAISSGVERRIAILLCNGGAELSDAQPARIAAAAKPTRPKNLLIRSRVPSTS